MGCEVPAQGASLGHSPTSNLSLSFYSLRSSLLDVCPIIGFGSQFSRLFLLPTPVYPSIRECQCHHPPWGLSSQTPSSRSFPVITDPLSRVTSIPVTILCTLTIHLFLPTL